MCTLSVITRCGPTELGGGVFFVLDSALGRLTTLNSRCSFDRVVPILSSPAVEPSSPILNLRILFLNQNNVLKFISVYVHPLKVDTFLLYRNILDSALVIKWLAIFFTLHPPFISLMC